MKNFLIFIGGVITGIIVLIVFGWFLTGAITKEEFSNNKMTMFENEGNCISEKSFEVVKVLDSGEALADEIEQEYSIVIPTGLTVLFLCEDGESYYDKQIIKIPAGKCVRQVGIFKYYSRTIPIVSIRDK